MVRSLTGYLINRNNVLSNTLNRRFALEWSFQSSVEDPFHGSGSHLPLFDWLYVAVSINESHFKRSGTYTCRMSVGWQSSKCPGGESAVICPITGFYAWRIKCYSYLSRAQAKEHVNMQFHPRCLYGPYDFLNCLSSTIRSLNFLSWKLWKSSTPKLLIDANVRILNLMLLEPISRFLWMERYPWSIFIGIIDVGLSQVCLKSIKYTPWKPACENYGTFRQYLQWIVIYLYYIWVSWWSNEMIV